MHFRLHTLSASLGLSSKRLEVRPASLVESQQDVLITARVLSPSKLPEYL